MNLLDVIQNSISAKASLIQLFIEENQSANTMEIRLVDNGCGMTSDQVTQVTDPFYTTRTTRRVGLGIPLFKMAAEQTGGSLYIQSEEGKGTELHALFRTDSVDMTPLGDINGTVQLLIRCNPDIDFIFSHAEIRLDTREMREMLGDIPLDHPNVQLWLKEYLQ